jgi:hypothetical protein
MSSNLVLPISDNSSSANKLVELQTASSGISNINTVLSAKSSSEFVWKEPKEGAIAYLFPSSSTWHRLYNNDPINITRTLFDIDTSNLETKEKERLNGRVAAIIKQVPYVTYTGAFWQLLIAFCIICILYFLFKSYWISVFPGVDAMFPWFCGFVIVSLASTLIYAEVWAEGAGDAYWGDYIAELRAKLNSGSTLQKVLESQEAEHQRDLDRKAMIEAAAASARGNQGRSSSTLTIAGRTVTL